MWLVSPRTEQFGIRWIAEVQAQFTEPYTFWVESDDGLRLWLDERLVIDRWHAGGEENSATVEMVAGQKYLLRLEYAQNRGKAFARLRWSSPSTPKRVIPQSQLYSQPTDADGDGMPDLWERAYGLNPNDAGDTAMDPDGDGLRNLQEYRRGSDPTSPLHWGVPNDWATGDIEQWSGSKGNSARFNGGTFTVTSAGEDIWRRMDSFRFVYRPLEGDGEIVARVTGMTGTNGYAKAGVMVRETLDPDARNAMMLVTRSKGNFFQWRPAVWSECVQTAESTNTMTPHWVKIVRCGGWVGGYSSADGVNWKLVEWATFGGLPQRVFVGLAVSAGNKIGTPCEAVFDQVSVGAGNPAEMMHPVVGAGDGLVGSYFNNRNLAGAPVTNRLDSDIDFQWGTRGPLPGVGPDRFGVVWTGELQAQLTELYTLNIVSDDGARLWLNEELLLDTWAGAGTRRASTNVNMVAGQRYLLRLEYNDELSAARVGLRWSSPSTSLRLIPQSQLYSRVTDTDGDGMPDFWEIAHGLNANDANDAALDADGDGLTNLEEYRRRTNPRKGDSDDDGISDVWEIAHGLNASFNDASEDADADGLSNLREFQLQTDPYGWDSDGDGLPDLIEAEYLGTDPNVVNSGVLTEAAAANGAEGTILIGEWQADGTALCGMNRRGEVEYTLTTTNADKFLLKLEGGQRRPRSSQDRFNLRFSVDGESLGYHTLIGGYGTNGAVECLTPYLTAGTHKVRVLWDDAASFSGLRIERLALLSLSGSDTNLNGVRDWVEKAVRTESGIDTNTALTSIESPACVEGRDPYRSMMDLRAGRIGEMTNVVIRRNAGRRWFANVPLLSGEGTRVRGAFQNGALAEAVRIQWQPVNVLVSSNLTIRRGSSLLLTAQPTNVISGTMTITIGTNQISGPAAQPQPFEFSQAGVYTVTGTFTPLSGPPQSRTISVTVVGHRFPNDPACWVGQPREWRVPSVAQGVFIEVDPRIRSEQEDTQSGGGKILSLLADQNEPRYVVSRLGTGGPILDVARAECFRFWAARDTHLQVIETFEDGSQIAEMLLVQSPVASDVIIRLNVIVGGVIFEDGTTQRELTAADFDALGICRVRFIRPATSKTSVCHSITVLQGAALVGRIQ